MSQEPKVKAFKETDKCPEIWVKMTDIDTEKMNNLEKLITDNANAL